MVSENAYYLLSKALVSNERRFSFLILSKCASIETRASAFPAVAVAVVVAVAAVVYLKKRRR